jgi:DNA-binding transcriptional LysR family regulator
MTCEGTDTSQIKKRNSMRLLRLLISPQLHAFLAAGERRSFDLGAKAVHLSTSALKHRIAQLELQLGVNLVVRGSKPLRLTPAGGRLLMLAATVRNQCDELSAWVKDRGPAAGAEPEAPAPESAQDDVATLIVQANQLLSEAIARGAESKTQRRAREEVPRLRVVERRG